MKRVKSIIVEDTNDDVILYEMLINKYNKIATDVIIEIVGTAKDYISARELLDENEDIVLVFLDIHLGGVIKKNGLDVFFEYPNLSYIIVSTDEKAWKRIFTESSNRPHDFVSKAFQGGFSEQQFISAIQKFANEKKHTFFNSILYIQDAKIKLNDTVIISSQEIRVEFDSKTKKYQLKAKALNSDLVDGDNHYFNLAICEKKKFNESVYVQQLKHTFLGKLGPEYSLKNIVNSQQINSSQFVQINKFMILNLDFVQNYDRKNCNYFEIEIGNYVEVKSNVITNILCKIDCSSSKFLTDEVKVAVANYLDPILYRR